MSHLETAMRALLDSSDAQLKKLYVRKKAEPDKKKEDEDELSEEDAALLEQLMKE